MNHNAYLGKRNELSSHLQSPYKNFPSVSTAPHHNFEKLKFFLKIKFFKSDEKLYKMVYLPNKDYLSSQNLKKRIATSGSTMRSPHYRVGK